MPNRPLPFDLVIPEPCGENWSAMRNGGAARRHCDRCQTNVVDVSLLTGPELRRLVERTGGDFCARLTRLPGGMMMLREPPPPTLVSTASLLRGPLLAGAVLAGSALPLAAQSHAHSGAPVLSCAEVTALRQGTGLHTDGAFTMAAPAPAPAPRPAQAPQTSAPLSRGGPSNFTMGKPAVPQTPLHGTVRLPAGRAVRNGTVEVYNAHGFSKSMEIKPDGSFAGAMPFGKYWLRTEVQANDGELYAAVDEITLKGQPLTHDPVLQGPVSVTAGAPMPVPTPKSQKR